MTLPPNINPLDYAVRCSRLRGRGLSEGLVQDLQAAGNLALLIDLESITDEQLVEMSRLGETRDAAARNLAELAQAPAFVATSYVCPICAARAPLTQADIDFAARRWAEAEVRARRLGADMAAAAYDLDAPEYDVESDGPLLPAWLTWRLVALFVASFAAMFVVAFAVVWVLEVTA